METSPATRSNTVIVTSEEALSALLLNLLPPIVRKEIWDKAQEDLLEKLLSPEETRKLFHPEITRQTVINWTKEGRLKSYRIGGKIYYKYSEVIGALTSLKKYQKSL